MTNKISVSFSQIILRVCNLFMSVFFSLATYSFPHTKLLLTACVNSHKNPCFDRHKRLYASYKCINYHLSRVIIVADLHVLVASTFGLILGWKLYKEGITDIFQQEEGTTIESFDPRFSRIRGITQIYFTGVIFALRECSRLLMTVFWLSSADIQRGIPLIANSDIFSESV
ncbi:transmembrane protein 220 [Siphateles boraxobius]|uniref:transmembrane protein 220 n=1 Tax=Siphateles boraxobius TaxID=180520 RepID=UPI004064598F